MITSDTPSKKIWSILELITWGTNYLSEKGFEDSRLTIELLLSDVVNKPRIHLYTNFDQPLSEQELASFKEKLQRRLRHEPLQYIIGDTEFMGFRFSVDRRVLIPRPETELLVENAVSLLSKAFPDETEISILDIGTGSGCIAVSMAKMIPRASVIAVDNSLDALEVAKNNAIVNAVSERIQFIHGDVLSDGGNIFTRKYHCILSNPPYISEKEFAAVSIDVRDFEPKQALSDDGDGLKFYPVIANGAKDSLIENAVIGVEHAFDQSDRVREIFNSAGFNDFTIVKDYQGINRHLFTSQHH